MFKYFLGGLITFVSCACLAQTPEQLELMRTLGIEDEPAVQSQLLPPDSTESIKSETVVQPHLSSSEKIDPSEELVPLADMSIYTKPDNEMTQEEVSQKYADFLQGRITIMMKNMTVYKTPSGREVCTVDVELKNNSGRTLKDLYIVYSWGAFETFVKFSGVKPFTRNVFEMGSADDYCSLFYQQEAKKTITSCEIDGLTFEACKQRIVAF